jgi:tetratricopeptide (TPR) repeat protein
MDIAQNLMARRGSERSGRAGRRIGTVAALAFAGVILVAGCSSRGTSPDKIREYANALASSELYAQAVQEYQKYLDTARLNDGERANVTFVVANLYFERLHDYENALANYLRIKHLYPESTILPEVERQIVACLERLNRSADAKQALDEATALDRPRAPSAGSTSSKIIARIGDRPITNEDLKFQLNQLPDYIRGQFATKAQRLEFLRQFIATELFYGAAQRKGLDRDKDAQEAAFQAKRSLMVQKYLQQEIAPQIKVSTGDLQVYFRANKEKYAEKDAKGAVKRERTFEEVQKQVAEDMVREKQQQAVQELLGRMMTAEGVQIYDDLVE